MFAYTIILGFFSFNCLSNPSPDGSDKDGRERERERERCGKGKEREMGPPPTRWWPSIYLLFFFGRLSSSPLFHFAPSSLRERDMGWKGENSPVFVPSQGQSNLAKNILLTTMSLNYPLCICVVTLFSLLFVSPFLYWRPNPRQHTFLWTWGINPLFSFSSSSSSLPIFHPRRSKKREREQKRGPLATSRPHRSISIFATAPDRMRGIGKKNPQTQN